MERYHIYKLGFAILFYAVYYARQTVVNGLKIDDVTSTTNTTDYRERRDSGDDNAFFYQGADGTPGVDFPTLSYVPRTKFSCRDMEAGYYADLETDCQVFHICDEGRKLSFLCPNGTTFHQSELICDWWFKVNCTNSPLLYEESAEILQRENAKRKDSRRLSYHGTKQGVFSSKEDYDHGQDTFGGTPAHLVTPSYRSSLKNIDNRISATTEGSARRNYNGRGDRTLDSFGNGVRERDHDKTNQFSTGRSQNAFGINLQGKSGERGQTVFSTNTQQKPSTVGQFSFNRESHSTPKSGSFGTSNFGTNGKSDAAGHVTFDADKQVSFDRSSQQTTKGRDQNSFGANVQSKAASFGKSDIDIETQVTSGTGFVGHIPFDRTAQRTTTGRGQNTFSSNLQSGFGSHLQEKAEIGKQATFGSGTHSSSFGKPTSGQEQNVFGSNIQGSGASFVQSSFGAQLQAKPTLQEQTTFGTGTQHQIDNNADRSRFDTNAPRTSEHGQNTFGARLQGGLSKPGQSGFGVNFQGKTETAEQVRFGVQGKEGESASSQKTGRYNQNRFGSGQVAYDSSTQQTAGRSSSQLPLDRSSQRTNGRDQNIFGSGQATFGSNTQQRAGGNVGQLPLDRTSQKASERDQNIFGGGQITFGTNTQQTVGSSASQIPLDRNSQRTSGRDQNIFGSGQATFGSNTQQTAGINVGQLPLDRTSQKASERDQNVFGGGQITFSTNTQQTVGSSASQIPLDRNSQRASGRDQNIFGSGQATFGSNTQQTAGINVGQLPLDRTSQKASERDQNVFGGGQITFGTNTQQTVGSSAGQIPLDRNSQRASGSDQNIFGSGQVKFGSNTPQRASSNAGQLPLDRTSQRTSVGDQNIFGGPRATFGSNAQQTAGSNVGQLPLDRTSQKASERDRNIFGGGQITFGTNTQQTVGSSAGQIPLDRNSQNIFGSRQVTFGSNTHQRAGSSAGQLPLDRTSQKTSERDQNVFGGGQITFGTNTQQTATSSAGQIPLDRTFGISTQQRAGSGQQGNGQVNVFGVNAGTTSSHNRDGEFDKIKFSISSQGKLDEFDTSKQQSGSGSQQNIFGVNAQNQLTERGHTTGYGGSQITSSGAGQNRFDLNLQGKSGKFDQTTSSFGLKSNAPTQGTFRFTSQTEQADDSGQIPVLIVSAETQEPQESASFVKSGRNNLLVNNRQTTINPYPNHRETYSDIKDPRHYYQQPQNKLPEKPFYGSSVSPQVLSTVPVSAYDGSSTSTTEISLQKETIGSNFGLRTDISTTKRPALDVDVNAFRENSHGSNVASTTFAPFKEAEQFSIGKSPVTTNRFSFGLNIPQTTKSAFDLDTQNIDVSTNRGINSFGQTTTQPTTRSATIGSNKVDVTTYDRGYTNGVDLSLNSISSTLLPDISDDIEGKSTIYPGSRGTNYYDGTSSTPDVSVNHFGFGSIRTTEKPYENSPIIKLNIMPSTVSPDIESSTRSGKAFNGNSPKIQVITLNGPKTKDFNKGPFEVTGNVRDGNKVSVSFGTGEFGKPIIKEFTSGGQTVPQGFIKVKTNGISSNGNSVRVITGVNITPSVSFKRFGGTTAGAAISSRTSSTAAKGFENKFVSTPSTKETSFGDKAVDININTFPSTDRDNLEVTPTEGKVGFDINTSTRATPIETETVEFTINDETFTTPGSGSTGTIDFNINNENYSAPSSVFSATRQGGLGITETTATPFRDESTSNILYTSTSSVLQPKPFSVSTETPFDSSKTGVTDETFYEQSGTPQVPPYTISSASPFTTTSSVGGEFDSKTPTPTLPTPYTTETSLYSYKPTDENINNMINTLMEVVRQRFGGNDTGFGTPRPGLVVPPSAGPQTLHTLAIYFANALDNLTASSPREQSEERDEESETDSPIIHIDNEELIKSLLTQMTLNNYEHLFKEKDATTTELPFSLRSGADDNENDLIREDTKHPTEGPGVRQLARVFTEALSAYLEDPDTFKKVLHDVRPTEPPQLTFGNETTEAEEDEVLNYSDSDLKSDHPHLPARPTGIPVSPTWGYLLAFNKSSPTTDNLESHNSLSSDSENLQSADSQSFVSQLNKVTQAFKTTLSQGETRATTEASDVGFTNGDNAKALPKNHWTTSSDVTKLWQTTLSINPADLNENFDSSQTAEGFTSADIDTRFTAVTGSEDNTSESSSDSGERAIVSEIQYELRSLPKIELNSTQVHGILIDFMNATKTDGSGKLQRILHKLNISQDEFLNKMKEIEGNPLTRRLILLLISECNTDKNKELETRAASSDGLFGLTQSKLILDNTEQHAVTSRQLNSADANVATTESNSFQHIVHPSLHDNDEDTRALELLNSLYVIASKFGK